MKRFLTEDDIVINEVFKIPFSVKDKLNTFKKAMVATGNSISTVAKEKKLKSFYKGTKNKTKEFYKSLKSTVKKTATDNIEYIKKTENLFLKNKEQYNDYQKIKELAKSISIINKNLVNTRFKVNPSNENLAPFSFLHLHKNLNLFSKILILLAYGIENKKLKDNDLLNIGKNLDIVKLNSDDIIDAETIIRIEKRLAMVYVGLSRLTLEENTDIDAEEKNLKYSFTETINERDRLILRFESYLRQEDNDHDDFDSKKHHEEMIKKYTDETAAKYEESPDEKKSDTKRIENKKSSEIEKRKPVLANIDPRGLDPEEKEKFMKILKSFVDSLKGLPEKEVKKRAETFSDKIINQFRKQKSNSPKVVNPKQIETTTESVAQVRWRRNPRTGLNKVVMVCKSDEYKKPLNREITVAGKKVKEVMCLPKTTKPAKQKERDRKASLKRWRKIKANPGKMKKMFVKRQQTKARSQTLR
tara:strand:+ start:25347 stop:26762 length:1416 start_codon:yes stop_codon:yes gene_type:complete